MLVQATESAKRRLHLGSIVYKAGNTVWHGDDDVHIAASCSRSINDAIKAVCGRR